METITDHVARALARLPEQMRMNEAYQTFLHGIIRSIVEPLQVVEQAAADVRAGMHPAGAIGVQLDGLGKIVRWPRRGMSDNAYRPMLQVANLVNKNAAITNEVLAILAVIEPALPVLYLESHPAEYVLRLEDVETTPKEVMREVVMRTKPGGVRVVLETHDVAPSLTWHLKRFADADTDGPDTIRSWFEDPGDGARGLRAWSDTP